MHKSLSLLIAVFLALASFSTALADSGYIVQRGDTLYRIAARFGVTAQAIADANQLRNPNLIHVGQRLIIPGPGGYPAPTTPPWAGQYVVQRGDTLWRIARRFGSTVDALKTANHLRSNLIYPGQILILPGAQPAPTAPAPAPSPAPVTCALDWFFSRRPSGCPAAPAQESHAAAERFERGLMIWFGATDTYYVFHNLDAGGALRLTLVQGPLTLKPGANPNNRVGGAPPGLTEPVSGFGLLWRGEVEGVYDLRGQLGWAVEPEYAFQTKRQCETYPGSNVASPTCYLRLHNGAVYQHFYVQYFGNFWQAWL